MSTQKVRMGVGTVVRLRDWVPLPRGAHTRVARVIEVHRHWRRIQFDQADGLQKDVQLREVRPHDVPPCSAWT